MASSLNQKEHYEFEKQIASRLRDADVRERKHLYGWAYDSIYSKVPGLRAEVLNKSDDEIAKEIGLLAHFVDGSSVYLEIGPGNCGTALAIAKRARRVIAVDVTRELAQGINMPENLEFLISDGTNIPLPAESVDIIYSNQLMEHLHPDDAGQQLHAIYETLKTGGKYICITPNRLSGPHDVSRDFDDAATGLHLQEYTTGELDKLFAAAGFRKRRACIAYKRHLLVIPTLPIRIVEAVMERLPASVRKLVTFNRIVRFVMGVKFLATK